jgi:hypothetical protein
MNFEVTQQRIKHLYEQNRDQEAGTRRVAAVSTTSKNKRKYTGPARGGGRQGGRGRGRGSGGAGRSPNTTPYGPNRLNHGIGHYDKDIGISSRLNKRRNLSRIEKRRKLRHHKVDHNRYRVFRPNLPLSYALLHTQLLPLILLQ